jgi:hypothetical protein
MSVDAKINVKREKKTSTVEKDLCEDNKGFIVLCAQERSAFHRIRG